MVQLCVFLKVARELESGRLLPARLQSCFDEFNSYPRDVVWPVMEVPSYSIIEPPCLDESVRITLLMDY